MEWIYYKQSLTEAISYDETGAASQAMGKAVTPKIAQMFEMGDESAWMVDADCYFHKVGTPTDNVKLTLHEDNAGVIGNELVSGTLGGAAVSATDAWTSIILDSGITLEARRRYWKVLSRSGATDEDNYYVFNVNESSTFPFKVQLWDGAAWSARAPAGTIPFLVNIDVAVDTTEQLRMIAANCGQFLAGSMRDGLSGVTTNAQRNGDTTGKVEAEDLLKSGTNNGKRLLATVTIERILHFYEEESLSLLSPSLTSVGQVRQALSNETIPPEQVPARVCGRWLHYREMVPPTILAAIPSSALAILVGQAEYEREGQRVNVTPIDHKSEWEFTEIKRG